MKCKFCNTTVEKPSFDIGNTAVSNDLIPKDRLNSLEKTYPLIFYVCPLCLLAQTEQYKEGYEIFGDDYETRDGTGERDYIHVTDLAKAHLAALDAMLGQSGFEVYNIGTGTGATVKELLAAYETACGHKLAFEVTGRRSGDVASSVASPKKANERLHWVANLSIDEATSSSWQWQSQNPDGYAI